MRLASLALLVLALAGCGGAAEPEGPTRLTISVLPGGEEGAAPVTATLRCDPPRGDVPDPVQACAALEQVAVRDALAPTPPDTACTEIWGGPETARIRGTVDGEPIDATVSRQNGCEIARWDALSPVLPAYPSIAP